jgi:hypothetical protein
MAQFLRQLTDAGTWANNEQNRLWGQGDCPAAILNLMRASTGFSVWKVQGDEEILRTVAATALLRNKLDDVVYILLDESAVLGLGIRLEQKDAKTLDQGVNKNHYDLIQLTGSRFLQLAKTINESSFNTIQHDDILESIKMRFQNGTYNRDSFSGKSGNTDLMRTLFRGREIDFI